MYISFSGSSKADLSSHEYSNILMATLVMQDVLLSFFISLLPGMAGHAEEGVTNRLVVKYACVLRAILFA